MHYCNKMFAPSPSSSICSVVPLVQVVIIELLVWLTRSWHVQVHDTKNLDLQNNTPPNELSLKALFGCISKVSCII